MKDLGGVWRRPGGFLFLLLWFTPHTHARVWSRLSRVAADLTVVLEERERERDAGNGAAGLAPITVMALLCPWSHHSPEPQW